MFEATVGEYDETVIIGQYETEDEALAALGRHCVQHNDVEYPRVRDIGHGETFLVMWRNEHGVLLLSEHKNEGEARRDRDELIRGDVRATYVRVNV